MSFPAITQVDAYWEKLRAGRLMPERGDVDPRGMDRALEYTFMLELIAPRVARIRIAGNHLHDILGMEVRGMPLSAFFDPSVRDKLGEMLERVTSTPLVAEFKISSPAGIGRPAIEGQMYLAPLGSQEDGVKRILGCIETKGAIGRAPRRFDISQVKLRRIVQTAGAAPEESAPEALSPKPETATDTPMRPVPMQFAESPSDFVPAPKKSKGTHLRVVK